MESPTVESYISAYCGPEWARLYAAYREPFELAPAGETRHHNFTGGLSIHTAEVIRAMFEIRENLTAKSLAVGAKASELRFPDYAFSDEDIVVAAFLHDFAKIVQYVRDESGDWKFSRMSMPQETWTLMTLAQHGVTISEDQTLSLLYAEGGFSHFRDNGEPNALSWLLHMADIWSSQIICPTLVVPLCPRCGKDMKKRKGPRGYFWGCVGYPACSMTINIES